MFDKSEQSENHALMEEKLILSFEEVYEQF